MFPRKDETKAVACNTRSKKPELKGAGVSSVPEEDEEIPLVSCTLY